jgi:hypothetical protein
MQHLYNVNSNSWSVEVKSLEGVMHGHGHGLGHMDPGVVMR